MKQENGNFNKDMVLMAIGQMLEKVSLGQSQAIRIMELPL